ncbi:Putative Genomic scaffold, msy_sf_9 [Rhizopus microsporus]|nr:Putative Genomic scaffold, msy_sf_9 [Rhizopus microsporus]
MSKNLSINTTPKAIDKRYSSKPDTLKDENTSPQRKQSQGFIEENDDDDEEEEEEDEEEEEEEGSDFSSSPSIPDENINFDLVYTLHTFEATVDGQVSVKKGDALTLLDDSNSYWWLIKDLKTSEVGYIPAENIETPFERLARLNKHRNVEITSLGHAAHYIKNNTKQTRSRQKKVMLSPSVKVQLEVILADDENEETTYEEWNEELIDNVDDIESEEEKEEQPDVEEEEVKENETERTSIEDTSVSSKVLRVYAGKLNVGASYHSIRVTENMSTSELLSKAMEKFHIPQIDKHHKRSSSSVEYYLSIRNRDGDEITLEPEDRPYSIYESLNTHLTTPMPSLSEQFKLSGTLKKKKKRQHDVQFSLHKRIKRMNEGGLVHIKLSLLAQKAASDKGNAFFQSWLMKKKKKVASVAERIDKVVAVHDTITIAQLTRIAFEKFHIVPHESHSYRLLLHTKNRDTLLNSELILTQVLKELGNDEEKQFILHNFSSTATVTQNNSKSNNNSKSLVFPSDVLGSDLPAMLIKQNISTPS